MPHAIAATDFATCALDGQGAIHCWGQSPEVWQIPQGSFVELYGGSSTICAVRADRTVTCFPEPTANVVLDYVPQIEVLHLGIGLGVICGIDGNAGALCGSANQQLALTAPANERFVGISAGNQFACGIREADGTITCWSAETFGNCGYSPASDQLEVPAGSFVEISGAAHSTCALSTDSTIACWGLGEAGDDPSGSECFASFNLGQSDPPAGTYRTVAAGENHTCAIRSDGTLACWGAGITDDCVSGTINCRQSLPPPGAFEQVAVGIVHNCAMTANRTVQCWGYAGPNGGDGRTVPPGIFQ